MKTFLPNIIKCLPLLLLITTSSCKDEDPQPTKEPKELLQGEWHTANEYYKYYDEKGKLVYQVSGLVVVSYYEFSGDTLKASSGMPDRINDKPVQRSSWRYHGYEVKETENGLDLLITNTSTFKSYETFQLVELSNDRFVQQYALTNTSRYIKEEQVWLTADKAIRQLVFKRGFTHENLPERTEGRRN